MYVAVLCPSSDSQLNTFFIVSYVFIRPHIAFTAAVWPFAFVVEPPFTYCLPSPQVFVSLT